MKLSAKGQTARGRDNGDTFALAYPSRRYRSALIGIIVHGSQQLVILTLVLFLVLQ